MDVLNSIAEEIKEKISWMVEEDNVDVNLVVIDNDSIKIRVSLTKGASQPAIERIDINIKKLRAESS